jgi:hypothetical protein
VIANFSPRFSAARRRSMASRATWQARLHEPAAAVIASGASHDRRHDAAI